MEQEKQKKPVIRKCESHLDSSWMGGLQLAYRLCEFERIMARLMLAGQETADRIILDAVGDEQKR